jgi:hypothetical protein
VGSGTAGMGSIAGPGPPAITLRCDISSALPAVLSLDQTVGQTLLCLRLDATLTSCLEYCPRRIVSLPDDFVNTF